MAGLRESFGRISAGKWSSDFRQAVGSDTTLSSSTNMEDFDAFYGEHRTKWLEENVGAEARDQYFETGFGNKSQAYYEAMRDQFATQTSKNTWAQSVEALQVEIGQHLDNVLGDPTLLAKMPREQIAASIGEFMTSRIRNYGMDGSLVNKAAAQAVVQWAVNNEDITALDLLKQIPGGTKGSNLLNIVAVGEMYTKAQEDIARWSQFKKSTAETERKRAEEAEQDAIFTSFIGQLENTDTPSSINPTPLINALIESGQDPLQATQQVHGMLDVYGNRIYHDDEYVAARLWSDIFNVSNVEDPSFVTGDTLRKAFLVDRSLSNQTFNAMNSALAQRESRAGSGSETDPILDKGFSDLRSLFKQSLGEFENTGDAVRFLNAKRELNAKYAQWRFGEGKDATPAEAREWVTQQALLVGTRRIGPIIGNSVEEALSVGTNIDWEQGPVVEEKVFARFASTLIEAQRSTYVGQGFSIPEQLTYVLLSVGLEPTLENAFLFMNTQASFYPEVSWVEFRLNSKGSQ
jgi:hypothetical protein